MSIKLGIIGAGAIGEVHTQAAKRAGIPVVGIADVNAKAAAALAGREGVAYHTGNIAELLASDADAVVVAVPNKFHAPLAIQAMQAGKDVLVEKPMALNLAECQEMVATAKKTKRILQVGFVQRYTASAIEARKWITKGKLGDIYHAKCNYYRRRGIPGLGGWFTTKGLSGGGPLIDLGVHIVDLSLYVTDFPKPVRVSGKVYANFGPRMKKYVYEGMWAGPPNYKGKFDVEDAAHALVRFDNGMTLEVNTTWAGNFPEGGLQNVMGFFGDKGGITFQLGSNEIALATEQDGRNVDIKPALPPTDNWVEQANTFAAAVKSRKPSHASGESGLCVQTILDAIYESSKQDREIEL